MRFHSTPSVVGTRAELEAALGQVRRAGGRVALVPTMGALHRGHGELMDQARRRITSDGVLVVSVFVNPTQFAPGEDLERYPRAFDADLGLCAEHEVNIVFAPSVEEVYPRGAPLVTVDPGPLAEILEGAVRPAHFRGVLTVVAQLFGLVRPELAVFGQKDYQQLVLIRRMVADLCLPVAVLDAETLREPDGLAMSSRNQYLSAEERAQAVSLSRALTAAAAAAAQGPRAALAAAEDRLRTAVGVEVDYLELTSPDLGPAPSVGDARLLVAARVGATRLIDNAPVHLGPGRATEADLPGSAQ
ncbi:pantoate--beta-alanine ligase [soil metagenome]